MTTIAELFVNLGVKGTDKTLESIGGMKKGLKDTASGALEAKVAIVGAMYALERLFATSGQAGTGLVNFTAETGMSAKALQQYQYAARQVGVSNEEMANTFKALQSVAVKTQLGEAPKGLARVSAVTGITMREMQEFAKQPEKFLQVLQQYAEKEGNIALRNEVLKSMGITGNMNAALARQAFKPEVLDKAPVYSDKENTALDKANIAWSNLSTKIEMAVGHFNAKHGGEIVGNVSKIVDQVIRLTEAFTKLAEKAEIFKWIGKSIEGWQKIFEGLSELVDKLNGTDFEMPEGQKEVKPGSPEEEERFITMGISYRDTDTKAERERKAKQQDEFRTSQREHTVINDMLSKAGESFFSFMGKTFFDVAQPETTKRPIPSRTRKPAPRPSPSPAAPIMPAAVGGGAPAQDITVTQTLNFQHDGKDATKTGDSTKKAVKDAFRQMSAQAQGS